jgi:predicted transcriptional regulator
LPQRTRLEVYFDALLSIRRGHKNRVGIMYAAHVSWRTLQPILESLITLGPVKEVRSIRWRDKQIGIQYGRTPKGENLMRYLRDHKELLRNDELRDLFSLIHPTWTDVLSRAARIDDI